MKIRSMTVVSSGGKASKGGGEGKWSGGEEDEVVGDYGVEVERRRKRVVVVVVVVVGEEELGLGS